MLSPQFLCQQCRILRRAHAEGIDYIGLLLDRRFNFQLLDVYLGQNWLVIGEEEVLYLADFIVGLEV